MTTPDDIRIVPSEGTVEQTLGRLRAAVASRGLMIFAEIDHAANARAAGLEMPAATVVVFGTASTGTPLMVRQPDVALELPLRVLVREDAQRGTVLTYRDPLHLARAFGVEDMATGIAGLAALVTAVAGGPAAGPS